MNKLSIITPSFNQGIFIEDAIKSVLDQNYAHFEHIIIDGGSTDGTIEILKKYKHLKWISEPDEGQSDAINKGFQLATGDIVGWLNSDDMYLPGVFDRVVAALENTKLDAIYANYKFVDKLGRYIRDVSSHRPVKWLSLFHCYIPSTTFFFKRSIIDERISIDKQFQISMDKEFFAHILYSGYQMHHINVCFAKFRWHDNNKSLDSKVVKAIRYREGLMILNRYLKLSLPVNNITIKLYSLLTYILMVYRKILKIGFKQGSNSSNDTK